MLRVSRAYVAWVLALAVGVVGGVVFLAPVSSAEEPQTGSGSISGTVTWPLGEDPEPFLLLHRWGADEDGSVGWNPVDGMTLLSRDGAYEFKDLPAGKYLVQATDDADVASTFHGGSLFETATVIDVAEGAAVRGIDIALEVGGSISGMLTVPDGTDVVDLYVLAHVSDDDGRGRAWREVVRTRAEPDGHYQVRLLPAGTYRLQFVDEVGSVQSEFYADAATVEQGTDVVVGRGAAVFDIDAALESGGTISGRVTSSSGSEGIGKVKVSVYELRREDGDEWWASLRSVRTGPEGRYLISGLTAGTYRVGFEDVEHDDLLPEFHRDAGTVEEAADVEVGHHEVVTVDAVLEGGASVAGTVSATGSSPVHGLEVSAYRREGAGAAAAWRQVATVETVVGGGYRLTQLARGTYRIGFEDPSGALAPEFWDDAATVEAGRDVVVGTRAVVTGINAGLSVDGPPRPTPTPTVTVGPTPVPTPTPTLTPAPTPTPTVTSGPTAPPTLTAAPTPTPTAAPTPQPTPAPTPSPTPRPEPAKALKRLKAPKVTGKAKVGKTLRVSKGTWKPKSVTVKYRWYVKKGKKAVKVKAATKSKLKLKKSTRGKRYRVVVTVSKKGYKTVRFTSKWSQKVK